MKKYLGPLTNSSYVRIGAMLLAFYLAVQWMTGDSKLDQAVLIEDLRATAQNLAQLSDSKLDNVPSTMTGMKAQGLITGDLLERCRNAKVNFHPENVGNRDGMPVFSVPVDNSQITRVTATGLVLR
jgi:hypothetical protein